VFACALAVIVSAGVPSATRAQPDAGPIDVSDAPRPDQASGRLDTPQGDSVLRWAARGLLFVPKLAVIVIAAPIRGGLYAADRFGAANFIGSLFTSAGPVQVFPAAQLESGFGVTYGVGALYQNIFGRGERLRGEFLFGGPVRQVYRVTFNSGQRFGQHDLSLKGEAQFLKNSLFFGIGMSDAVDLADVMGPIDPTVEDTAVISRFDQEILRSELALSSNWAHHIRSRLSTTLTLREFSAPSARFDDIRDVYDPTTVVGLEDGLSNVYSEVAIGYDSRTQPNRYLSREIPSTGWNTELFAGYARGVGDDPSNYFRYGIDAQRYIRLLFEDRTVVLRGQFEGVTGGLDSVPFVDLPRVGGTRVLRGYLGRRFRDRFMAAATLEYRYPISQMFTSYVFLDAGSVAREVSEFDTVRFGGGGGVILHTKKSTVLRLLGAYGSEGFVFAISLRAVTINPRRSNRR
jgi:hypothetical protein